MSMTEQTDPDGRWSASTSTGPADFTSVTTQWEDQAGAFVTRVSERVGARWIPLEYHRSDNEGQAGSTHRAAVRRHPKKGTTRTLPRRYGDDGRCTRCGEPAEAPHAAGCRD